MKECDLCGRKVKDRDHLHGVDFYHYGSSGAIDDYYDACTKCYQEMRDKVNSMIEAKEGFKKRKQAIEECDKAVEKAYNKTYTEADLKAKSIRDQAIFGPSKKGW